MVLYLRAKKLDITTGDVLIITVNSKDAEIHGIHAGQDIQVSWGKNIMIASIDITEGAVNPGEVGFFADSWDRFEAGGGSLYEIVELRILEEPESVKYITKKLKGGRLNYEEMYEIMKDIASHRLGTIETAYFAATGYNPGFDEEEIYFATKAMAETGDMLRFEGIVADKHSVGGVPGKGVTPIVIPIVSSTGVIMPNTTTRAITSSSATTDMLEAIMPMSFKKEQIEAIVMRVGACMVWGGGLELAPADDEMIKVEKPLEIESFDKFVISILAKKVAPGIQYLLIDLPYGPGTKVKSQKDVEYVGGIFRRIAAKFGIKIEIYKRQPVGPDGNAIGPVLECREFLRVLQQKPERSLELERIAVEMSGILIEMTGKAEKGKGFEMAKEILVSGKALNKFYQIVEAQNGRKNIKSEDLKFGEITYDYISSQVGTIKFIDNRNAMDIARGLGNPYVKKAGIYFHKMSGDNVTPGDTLATLYATSHTRMEAAKSILKKVEIFHIE